MIIATLNPEEKHELNFELKIDGSQEEPSDLRFVIEGQPLGDETVQDQFSIICRAVRRADSVTVYVPRLLNLFRGGSYKARLEVVLENRLFVPLSEEIVIDVPISVRASTKKLNDEFVDKSMPEISVSLSNIIHEILNSPIETIPEPPQIDPPKKLLDEELPDIDDSWKSQGFKGLKNPFK